MQKVTFLQTHDGEFETRNRHLFAEEIKEYKYFVERIITDEEYEELAKMNMTEIKETVSNILSSSIINID